ncbi:MAG: hypothetical protein WCJ61_12820 [Paludibacter sp.]
MQNKAGLIILFIVLSVVLFVMFSVDQWSSQNSRNGYNTTGVGGTKGELYTGDVSGLKGRYNDGAYSESSEMGLPGAVTISLVDVESATQKQISNVNSKGQNTFNHSQSNFLKSSGIGLDKTLARQTNPATDFDASLKAHTTEVKINATASTKSKTGSKAIDTKKKTGKMGLPAEPQNQTSLPIGDGMWLLLLMAGSYVGLKRILH